MTIRIIQSFGSEHRIKISDQLTVREFQKIQSLGELSLERFGKFGVLIELEGFQGWSKEPEWENSFFLTERKDLPSKIAVVGDEKWKDDVFLFIGKGMREAAIEFFPLSQLGSAKAWLSKDNTQSIFLVG